MKTVASHLEKILPRLKKHISPRKIHKTLKKITALYCFLGEKHNSRQKLSKQINSESHYITLLSKSLTC